MEKPEENPRLQWSATTKLVVTFVLVAIVIFLLWKFEFVLGPLLFAFVLAYLLHPLASFLHKRAHFPWRLADTLIYLLVFLIFFGLIAWGGISLITPLQNLVNFLQKSLVDLPALLKEITSQPIMIGQFAINLPQWDSSQLWTNLQGIISPVLSKIGTLLGNIASGAVSTIIWSTFTILISYFFSIESDGIRKNLIHLEVPRYQRDIEMMQKHLARIWDAFLKGQLKIFLLTYVVYFVLLACFGEHYFPALAILAGLARFVPYVGPFVAWTTYGLVAVFQGTTIFGLAPLPYALIIVGSAILVDVIMDNFVSPRVMSNALSIHPAVVLITVIVAANLIGFIGVLLAAPVVASLKLVLHYITRKLVDLDPWEDLELMPPPPSFRQQMKNIWKKFISLFHKKSHPSTKDKTGPEIREQKNIQGE